MCLRRPNTDVALRTIIADIDQNFHIYQQLAMTSMFLQSQHAISSVYWLVITFILRIGLIVIPFAAPAAPAASPLACFGVFLLLCWVIEPAALRRYLHHLRAQRLWAEFRVEIMTQAAGHRLERATSRYLLKVAQCIRSQCLI